MNAQARQRIRLNRVLRAVPGRKRAYRQALAKGSADGMLRALYSTTNVIVTDAMWSHAIMRLERVA